MPTLFAQVIIPYDSALPEDVAVNGFHFTGLDSVEDMIDAIYPRLVNFYDGEQFSGGVGLVNYLSDALNGPGARVKIYDLGDPKPRVPIFNESLGLGATNDGLPMPEEVALCLSYRAELVSGLDPRRRRGRLYIGPFAATNVTINGSATNNLSRPTANLISGLAACGAELAGANTPGAQWVVYSSVADPPAAEVVAGWVDNAWDTQRRRGPRADTRTNWSAEI